MTPGPEAAAYVRSVCNKGVRDNSCNVIDEHAVRQPLEGGRGGVFLLCFG